MDGKSEFKRDNAEVEAHARAAFGNVKGSIDGATASTEDLTAAFRQASIAESEMLAKQSSRTSTAKGQAAARDLLGYDDAGLVKARASAAAITAELKAMDKQAQAVRYALDPLAMATDRFANAEATLDKLLKNGKITLDQHAAALKIEKTALDQVEAAHRQGAKAVGLTSWQLRMMANATLPDVVQGLLSGQSAFQVFIQQGGQAAQIAGMGPGGFGAALRALVSPMALTVGGLGALAVGAGVLAVEMHKGAEAQIAYNNAILLTGGYVGRTEGQLYEMAGTVSKSLGVTAASVRDLQLQLVQSGKVGGAAISDLTLATALYAKATGRDGKDAVQQFLPLLGDTAQAAVALNQQMHLLTGAQILHIQALQQAGDKEAALKVVMDAIIPTLKAQQQNVGYIEQAWRELGLVLGDVWDKMRDIGRATPPTLTAHVDADIVTTSKKLAELQSIYESLRNQYNATGVRGTSVSAGELSRLSAEIDKTQTRLNNLKTVQGNIADQSERAAKAQTMTADAAAILVAHESAITRLKNEQKKLDDAANLHDKDEAKYRAMSASIGREIQAAEAREKGLKTDRRAESLAREAESVKVNTAETLKLADAYLQSDAAALKAEATRKAMTEATRKGTDASVAIRDQMALAVAQDIASGARSVANARAQAEAQKAVNDRVAAGTLNARDAARALQDEMAARSLNTGLLVNESQQRSTLAAIKDAEDKKDAKRAADLKVVLQEQIGLHERVARALRAQGSAQGDLNNAQNIAAIQAAVQATKDQTAALKDQLDVINDPRWAQNVELARRTAAREVEQRKLDPNSQDAKDRVGSAVESAQQQNANSAADYTKTTTDDLKRQKAMMDVELSMLGQKQSAIDKAMAIKAAELDIDRAGVKLTQDQRDAILGAVAAREDENAQLERGKAIMSEIRNTQDQLGDRVQAWLEKGKFSLKSLGDLGKSVLQDLLSEAMKLGAVNPFKNWAFGQDNPTFGSAGGLGSLIMHLFPGHADGTESAVPGYAWVGEEGPELRKVRAGDVIKSNPVSNAMTRSVLAQQPKMQPAPVVHQHFHLHAEGAVMTEDLIKGLNKQAEAVAKAEIKQYDKALPARVQGINRDPRKR